MLRWLVDVGNTVVTIEHDLGVIRAADWVIDLGPGGGAAGARSSQQGPRGVAGVTRSRAAAFLRVA